jgi:hypothetical protein
MRREYTELNRSNSERKNIMGDFNKNSEKQCDDINHNDNCENSLKKYFFSLPPKQFSILSSLIGILLMDDLDVDQLNA